MGSPQAGAHSVRDAYKLCTTFSKHPGPEGVFGGKKVAEEEVVFGR